MTTHRAEAGSTSAPALRVSRKMLVADGVMMVEFVAASGGRLADWTPGSHIDLVLPDGVVRQYSLCGDRFDSTTYRIAVLRDEAGGAASAYVHDVLEVGDIVGFGGPRNNFPLVPASRYLFVAGGIGITPLLPMIDQARRLGVEWRLLYRGRTQPKMAFADELRRLGDGVHVCADGAPDLVALADFLGQPGPGDRVYACGPDRLLDELARLSADWPPHVLRVERFVARAVGAPTHPTPFVVELARSHKTVTVAPDMSVLDALNGVGVEVLSSCRRGVCGTCESTVLSGRPDHRDALLGEDEQDRTDCMYVCVSRSRDDRLVLDL